MKQYGIVEFAPEGFYWMIATDSDINDAPQGGPFPSFQEAEKNAIEFLSKYKPS